MDWDKIKPLLDAKLNTAHIKPPKQFGPKGDYLEGWHVINEANRIFGYGGWSYTIDMQQADMRAAKDKNGNEQWQAAYVCICTVIVDGVTRQDIGYGSGFAKMAGDAIEGATKEAATDALKRALRTFGNQFGLALYDKDRGNVEAPRINAEQYQRLRDLVEQKGADESAICKYLGIDTLPEMPADRFNEIINMLNKKANKEGAA